VGACHHGPGRRAPFLDSRVLYYFVLFYRVHLISSIIVILFSLQMFDAGSHWNHLPTRVKPDLKDFLSTLLRSKADSTVKKYKNEILKFIECV